MVKKSRVGFFLLFLLFFQVAIGAEDISVASEIDRNEAYADEPLKGTVSITHDKNHEVDLNSFVLGEKEISVQLVKEVQISPNDPLILSIYEFKISGQPQGLYALHPVSVRVGGKIYKSPMSSYAVIERKVARSTPAPQSPTLPPATQSSPSSTASGVSSTPLLRLEANVEGNPSIYPGQRTKLTYHYYFTGDIALTTERLPLLDAEGFLKIGEKEIDDSIQGTTSVRKIAQQIEAVKPGTYSFGPSLIEGYAYKEESFGKPIYTSDKLSSKAPPVTVTVLPFPELNKPASFNGAVGNYAFKAFLSSPAAMTLGDEISLSLEIAGKGDLRNVKAPDLCCQPGYSGFFRLSDLPPSEEMEGETKKISLKLRPLNSYIQAIPSIEFSFFNPETAKYVVLHSEPIPITVKPSGQLVNEDRDPLLKEAATPAFLPPSPSEPRPSLSMPSAIEIESIFSLTANDLYNRVFGTWWSLAVIPFGIALLIFQNHLKEYVAWQRRQEPKETSQELFEKAFLYQKQGKCDFEMLKKSFKLALVEAGLLSSMEISDEALPEEGLCAEVKKLESFFNEKRFGTKGSCDIEEVYRLSENLIHRIHAVLKRNRGESL